MAKGRARGRGAKVAQSARVGGRKKHQTQDSVPTQLRRTSPPQELPDGEPQDSHSVVSEPDDGALAGLPSSDDEYLIMPAHLLPRLIRDDTMATQ